MSAAVQLRNSLRPNLILFGARRSPLANHRSRVTRLIPTRLATSSVERGAITILACIIFLDVSRATCKNLFVLVKRKKRPQPVLPKRQILCYHCGAPILADDRPGEPHPPYQCTSCGKNWPPNAKQEPSCPKSPVGQRPRARPVKITKAEESALRRIEREEEIYAKPPEQLTTAEWKWLGKVMAKIHRDPRGRKREQHYDDWMQQIARAKVQGRKPPPLQDLAGIKRRTGDDRKETSEYKAELDTLRDQFKKARKQRQIPAPPKR